MTRLICHRDKKITDPSGCEYVAEGDQYIYNGEIAITESGAYFRTLPISLTRQSSSRI